LNLHTKLLEREAAGRPVTVAVIGAGKFGTMFLSQARLTQGMHVVAVADLDVGRARSQLKTAGWPDESYAAASLAEAHKKKTTLVTDDADAFIADPQIEVIVEATGVPGAGIAHALKAIANGKHIVMVNVEADARGDGARIGMKELMHQRGGVGEARMDDRQLLLVRG